MTTLGTVYFDEGSYDQAIAVTQRALAIRENALGGTHPDVALVLNNLGGIYGHVGDYERGVDHLERALAIWAEDAGAGSSQARGAAVQPHAVQAHDR